MARKEQILTELIEHAAIELAVADSSGIKYE